jgi:acetolactate synthase-1/2/3 large subunit
MGYGLPSALGVAVSDNSRRTICIDGDGSIMMNIQELSTIAYNKLNIKIFIINNNGYHSIRQTQRNLFQPPFIGIDPDSGIGFPDFSKLSDAFGINYFCFDNEHDSIEIIKEVLAHQGPCICEVIVDSNQNFAPKSSSKILPDGKIISPSIDDMAPFLDRAEYESIKF